MDKQLSLSAFNDELSQVRTRKKEFLSQIERLIPWSPSILLRALLVMIAYKCVTITRWVTELRISPILAIICGFDPNHVPSVGTFYDSNFALIKN